MAKVYHLLFGDTNTFGKSGPGWRFHTPQTKGSKRRSWVKWNRLGPWPRSCLLGKLATNTLNRQNLYMNSWPGQKITCRSGLFTLRNSNPWSWNNSSKSHYARNHEEQRGNTWIGWQIHWNLGQRIIITWEPDTMKSIFCTTILQVIITIHQARNERETYETLQTMVSL